MIWLLRTLARRLRPAIGWPMALLALGAALTPAVAVGGGLEIDAGPIGWAGGLGLGLGLWAGRPAPAPWRAARALAAALAALGLLGLLLLVAGQALPPLGLLAQDVATYAGVGLGRLRGAGGELPAGSGTALRFLRGALPRLWRALLAAPGADTAGARLITLAASLTATWAGAIALGWSLAAGRPSLGWGMPLVGALGLATILGGGSGAGLLFGMGMLLALAVASEAARRRADWDRQGVDYADEIVPQTIVWGTAMICVALLAALNIPTAPPGWLSAWLWGAVPLPSGIAAIEAQVQRPRPASPVGLSQLPALALGSSLAQGPDEQLALRVRVGAALAGWPPYWRARVLERYSGRGWATAALGAPFVAGDLGTALPGSLLQEVEDLRPRRLTVVGLAEPIGLDAAAQAERLPDGSLAALTAAGLPARYRLRSLPPELAAPPPVDAPPPSLGYALALPAGLSARVGELARAIAGDAASPADQALALERYLRQLPYSYQVAPLPGGGDAVDQFLFEMRQGYCSYYASAMAIMARSLGIPARLAVGYASGSYDAADGRYLVREAEAHAWPELYIGGRWQAFEPTPIRPLPDRRGPAEPPSSAPPAAPPAPAPAAPIWPLAGGLSLLAALAAAWLALGRPRAGPLARAQLRLERLGARVGLPWPAGASLREYAGLLAPRLGGAEAELAELVALIEGARYGGRPLGPEQARRMDRALAAVGRRLR